MRSLALAVALVAAAVLGAPAPAAAASDTATGVVVVSAVFGTRTALKVSSHVLQFDVASPDSPATVALDFTAAARTHTDGEVVLSVEAMRALESGGAADAEASLTFVGEGDGTSAGTLESDGPAVAGRWSGSGRRTGRLIFSLRTGATGSYTVPVRFVLSTP